MDRVCFYKCLVHFLFFGVFFVSTNRKPYRGIEELVDGYIKPRGLLFSQEEESELKQYLKNIGYYRLSGYFHYFYEPCRENEHRFSIGTQWSEIKRLYDFDEKLRGIFFRHLLQLEIMLKAFLMNVLGAKSKDSEWIYNQNLFDQTSSLSRLLHRTLETNQHLPFIDSKEYPYFPKHETWKFFMLFSFGDTVTVLKSLKKDLISTFDKSTNQHILIKFNLEYQYLIQVINALRNIRNICAHSSRLWNIDHNKLPAIKPSLLKNQPLSKHDIDAKSLINAIMSLYLILKRTDAPHADAFLHDIDTWIKAFVPIEDLNNPYVRSLGLKTDWGKYIQTMQSF
jgi:abortive infection bacteriophage resistance protein